MWKLALAALALVGGVSAQSSVFSGTEHDGGLGIQDFELVDLSSDGVLDWVAAAWDSHEISVQLGLAGGGFASKVSYASNAVTSIEAFDANQDGHVDLAHSWKGAAGGQNVGLWLGSGTGALVFHGTLSSPSVPSEVVAADFNGDGIDDLATRSSAGISVALGAGGAAFGPFVGVGGLTGVLDVEAGDATGDGAPDLVAGLLDGSVVVLAGGAGGVAPYATLSAPESARAVAILDVSGDGILDVAVGSAPGDFATPPPPSSLELFLGDGAGGWSAAVSHTLAGKPAAIRGGDFDGDGLPDLVVATEFDATVLRGTPLGLVTFGSWAGGDCSGNCWTPSLAAFHDVDADGDVDLLIGDDGLRSYPQRGGTFGGTRVWRADVIADFADFGSALTVADLDGDGHAEAILSRPGGLGILVQDGKGGAEPALVVPGIPAVQIHTVQLDGDGVPDLLSYSTSPPAVHAQLGLASLGVTAQISQTLPSGSAPSDSVAADFDGDGSADVALALDGEVRVIRSDGAGGFQAPITLPFDDPRPDRVAAGDLNLDGFVDLAAVGTKLEFDKEIYTDELWRVYLSGAGGFSPAIPGFAFDLSTYELAIGDVNADGMPDMLAMGLFQTTLGPIPDRLRVHSGNGQGGFSSDEDYVPQSIAKSGLWVADLTGDGLADVLTAGKNRVALMAQTSGGTLAAPQFSYCGPGASAGVLADLNGDGWLDLARRNGSATSNYFDLQITVLPHVGAGAKAALPFGTGTPGCLGSLGLAAAGTPIVGASDFALVGSNVPPTALGFGFLGTVPDFPGSDPFALGLTLHIGVSGPLIPFAIHAGEGGEARAALPIPANPLLKGMPIFAQALWIPPAGQACGFAHGGWTTSRGLRLVLQ